MQSHLEIDSQNDNHHDNDWIWSSTFLERFQDYFYKLCDSLVENYKNFISQYDNSRLRNLENKRYIFNNADKVYYFVEWANESQKPSWVTKEAYP
jgi:hypothetical protein